MSYFRKDSIGKRILVWSLAIGILVPASFGFGTKLLQFFKTLQANDEGRFTLVPLLNYILVSLGFTCLLVWAICHGMFRNIEQPKYDMLEKEEQLDQRDGLTWSR